MAAKVYLATGVGCIVVGMVIDPGIAALLSILAVLFSSLFPIDYSRQIAKQYSAGVNPIKPEGVAGRNDAIP